jgi:dipeptidyl aminopeptidase/acylaminoacyl peptidase
VIIAADRADWDREIFQTDLWLYRDDRHGGGTLTQLTDSGYESSPRWSPDGQWVAFLSERKPPAGKNADDGDSQDAAKNMAQIYLISPNGGEAFPITSGADEVHAFAWLHDELAHHSNHAFQSRCHRSGSRGTYRQLGQRRHDSG